MNLMDLNQKFLDPDRVIARYVALRRIDRDQLLFGRSQTQRVTAVRHELMWILRELTDLTFQQIGERMGGRDYATVWHAVAKISDRFLRDPDYRQYMREVTRAVSEFEMRQLDAAVEQRPQGGLSDVV